MDMLDSKIVINDDEDDFEKLRIEHWIHTNLRG